MIDMKPIFEKAIRIPPSRWILLIQMTIIMIVIKIALIFISFPKVHQFIRDHSTPKTEPNLLNNGFINDICWAAQQVGRRLFGDNNCLIQALAGQYLLSRQGKRVFLRLGIKKEASGTLLAHAWIEDEDGQAIIGGKSDPALSKFIHFPDFEQYHEA